MKTLRRCLFTLPAAVLLAAGLVSAQTEAGVPGTAGATDASRPLPGRVNVRGEIVSDGVSVGVLLAASESGIEGGRSALKGTKTPEVKEYAERMVSEHTAIREQTLALMEKHGLKREESETGRVMKRDAARAKEQLGSLEGPEFDRLYVASAIKLHDRLQDSVEDTLQPSAENAELLALLKQVRETIVSRRNKGEALAQVLARRALERAGQASAARSTGKGGGQAASPEGGK